MIPLKQAFSLLGISPNDTNPRRIDFYDDSAPDIWLFSPKEIFDNFLVDSIYVNHISHEELWDVGVPEDAWRFEVYSKTHGNYFNLKKMFEKVGAQKGDIRMNKYIVIVHYEGALDFTVEANSEEEAEKIIETKIAAGTLDTENKILDVLEPEICDCWQI